jgi:hypothetical protein
MLSVCWWHRQYLTQCIAEERVGDGWLDGVNWYDDPKWGIDERDTGHSVITHV